ncbi:hypothetical protein AB0M02_23830 [Actinoplanes sp. NPDC051861]|uniref:hypothetical protein n=1 Tax=Actinoplanes sp. NPDC051861 TaxID=3155170 RepID=UPI0034479F1B
MEIAALVALVAVASAGVSLILAVIAALSVTRDANLARRDYLDVLLKVLGRASRPGKSKAPD